MSKRHDIESISLLDLVMLLASGLFALLGVGLGVYQVWAHGDMGAGIACFAGCMFISAFLMPNSTIRR